MQSAAAASHRDDLRCKFGWQEQRRRDALERQQRQRRDLMAHARGLVAAAESSRPQDRMDVSPPAAPPAAPAVGPPAAAVAEDASMTQAQPAQRRPHEFRDQLCWPEELSDVPENLAAEWLAVPVPAGQRCLVTAAHGQTVALLGSTGARAADPFQCTLPSGHANCRAISGREAHSLSILDCVLGSGAFASLGILESSDPRARNLTGADGLPTLYVLDVMCWKDYLLYDCDAEFRCFWRASKVAESAASCSSHARQVVPLPAYECTRAGLEAASQGAQHVLLYHRGGHYAFGGGTTPLVCQLTVPQAASLASHLL
jgi:snurportin-1